MIDLHLRCTPPSRANDETIAAALKQVDIEPLVDPDRWPGDPVAIRYRGVRWADARVLTALASIAKPLDISEVA